MMKFSHYISLSIIFHLTVTLLLSMVSYSHNNASLMFNVDIVEPDQRAEPAIKIRKKPVLIRKRRPADIHIKPDTLTDEDRGGSVPSTSEENKLHHDTEEQPGPSSQTNASDGDDETKRIRTIPPSALFDRNIIDKFASKEPARNKGLTFEAAEFKNRGYMRLLRDKIETIWKYPTDAIRHGRSGDLYIKFSIKKDGSLGNVDMIRTSGHRELDEAALKALKDGEPYWPLPDDWDKDELEITGHFIYVFGTTYLM